MLSASSIKRFQEIYQNEFGVDLTVEEATKEAQRLLNFAHAATEPIPKAYTPRYREIYEIHTGKPHSR